MIYAAKDNLDDQLQDYIKLKENENHRCMRNYYTCKFPDLSITEVMAYVRVCIPHWALIVLFTEKTPCN